MNSAMNNSMTSEFKPTNSVKSRLTLFDEKYLHKFYKMMLACLFEMYEAKLEQTIGLVKKGKI